MPPSVALPSPADRHRSLIYETHPQFGDYTYWPTYEFWTQSRQLSDGQLLLLRGRGRKPTDEQVALFSQIDLRLSELTASAIETVHSPPIKPPQVGLRRSPEFTRSELRLTEVRIEEDLSFKLFFATQTGDRIDLWPMVTFEDWKVVESVWEP